MPTFKALVFQHHKKDDGTYNVKIRITHNRVSRYIPTPFFVSQSQLTRSLNIKDKIVLEQVDAEIRRMKEKVYEIGFIVNELTIEQLIARINIKDSQVSFIDYMKDKIVSIARDHMRNKTAQTYSTALKALLIYTNNAPLMFSQMTKSYILNYYKYLLEHHETTTANTYITAIKTFYNMARKELNDEEADVIIVKYRCFDALELEKPKDISPRAFESIEEMQAVIDCPYSNIWIYDFAKDMFIFSFVCMGMNPADIFRLKKSDYSNGILTYRRKKTERRAGGKSEIKIKVPPVGQIIINKYSGDDDYLIDFRGHSRRENVCRYIHYTFQKAGIEVSDNSNINGEHKSRYVFYSARHTMASFARNFCNIDKYTVHEMLNHSGSRELSITDVYIRRDYTHLWEANEKLMALFNWDFYINQSHENNNETQSIIP